MAIFKDFFDNFFDTKSGKKLTAEEIELIFGVSEFLVNKYAQSMVAEKYGAALTQCLFTTYQKNEAVESDNYYRLNVEPNPNQSASEFKKQLARRLVFDGEALIIQTSDKNLYVAKSFQKGQKQLAETKFSNVSVDVYEDGSVSEYQLTGVFDSSNSIYMRYSNPKALLYIEQLNDLYKDLIDNVNNSGNSALKYLLKMDMTALNGLDVDINELVKQLCNEDFRKMVGKKNAILPIYKGMELEALNPANNNSQNASVASNNINNLVDDVLVKVGGIYNVPKSYMLGTYEKNDEESFLSMGLDPIATTITENFNRRYYTKKQYIDGTYCQLSTKKVKHFDILTISDSINKLISSGVYSINEVREILDEQPIEAEIGDKHWVTRNYAVVGDYLEEQAEEVRKQREKSQEDK